jgi:hypothetical protein
MGDLVVTVRTLGLILADRPNLESIGVRGLSS